MSALRNRIPLQGSDATLAVVVVVGFIALGLASHGTLFSGRSVQSILTYLTVPILIGLAQMVVLAVGQMNLAVGPMGGAACAIMAVLMADHHVPVWLALVLGFVSATAMGALNGALVLVTRLNGFIVTLGTMTILTGVQYRLVRAFTIDAYPASLKQFGGRTLFSLPYIFLIALLTSVAVAWYFARAVSGRRVLATGGNPLAARLSGISNDGSIFRAHLISGMLIGVAAILTIASAPGINRSIGGDWLLPSFAAPIIGGVLLTGGSVAVFGTVMAAGVLRLIDVARAQFSLDPSWLNFVIGAVVLSTVTLSEWRKRRESRRLMAAAVHT